MKPTIFDTCSNIDWQIFSIVKLAQTNQKLPDYVLSPPLNLNRWQQSRQASDNYADTFIANLQKLWGACAKRDIKMLLRLRVVPKNEEIISEFLRENDVFAKHVVLDLQGKCNQLYWNDLARHTGFVNDMVGVFEGRIFGVLANSRDNEGEQAEYTKLFKECGLFVLNSEDVVLKEQIFEELDLELIKRYSKFTSSIGQQSEPYKDTRKFLLRIYKNVSETDPFSKYRLENTLNCDDFEDLYKAFTLQQIYKRSSNGAAVKQNAAPTQIDIFKKRPDMEKVHPTVCVDLSWTAKMSEKEISKLVSQLARLHGANKQTNKRTRILFTSIVEGGFLHTELIRKFQDNITKWGNCYFMKKSYTNLVPKTDYNIIYLSPDSETPLADSDFDRNSCFIIGGLVDETVQSKLSLTKAGEEGIQTRRFPIEEHMTVPVGANTRPALAINQVGEVLFHKLNQGFSKEGARSWTSIFEQVLPARYGLS